MTVPRLYTTQTLVAEAVVDPGAGPAHYLVSVLRLGPGDEVLLFNGRDGEWRGRLVEATRKRATVRLDACTRAPAAEPGPHLVFAPIKKARLDFLVEKAVELGAARLTPVLTRHGVVDKVKTERLAATMTEAAEQCERLTVPQLDAPVRLAALLGAWPADTPLYAAIARDQNVAPWSRAVAEIAAGGAPPALLVGPEGGFSAEEVAILNAHAAVRPVALGPRILRAETAALTLLAQWQAVAGSAAKSDRSGP
ncbi:16S rRNA (uracil(1498)-N(3))-methyltransferase [Rhodothalassium salexigens]|uniref:16S rRNA (uracil(1498)-N(3))-methyltransferase n=1 Tax=Rhodothalassium salexigens TaxID=1086 RepID=UPI0019118337|nr:16S rRNA (uracil(1498)-N(3))-methyltransferase [Rhodothalassium salexigens]MBK5911182.1 16S rRNA (uracil(1498)-N(3))-methyltransferase [Rhodothalassium salexigens]MBK5921928.1 16S rRNA (uracil(1498)-N(3))-methyltransferase [Rhodothalassium salexigens]